jgi:hypothetical protein
MKSSRRSQHLGISDKFPGRVRSCFGMSDSGLFVVVTPAVLESLDEAHWKHP